MENNQTAVEWLEEKINLYNFEVGMGSMRKYIEYAKQIEKEQIMDAWDNGDCCIDLPNGDWEQKYKSAEEFYNETYGK